MVPNATRLGVLANPTSSLAAAMLFEIKGAAASLGIEPQELEVPTGGDLRGAFAVAAQQRVDALYLGWRSMRIRPG
jgi:ABC-type uncharacterized transport system substrate-binding protein